MLAKSIAAVGTIGPALLAAATVPGDDLLHGLLSQSPVAVALLVVVIVFLRHIERADAARDRRDMAMFDDRRRDDDRPNTPQGGRPA